MADLTRFADPSATASSPAPHGANLLRSVLVVDAATSAAAGLAMLIAGEALAPWLGLPAALLQYAGLALLPFAGFVAWLAARPGPAPALVWTVAALNLLWAHDGILLLLSGWATPTGYGQAFVIVQAVAVAVLAELQIIGLRRARRAAA